MCVYKYSIYRYCTLLICTLFVYIVCYASLGMYVTPLRPEPDAHMLCKLISTCCGVRAPSSNMQAWLSLAAPKAPAGTGRHSYTPCRGGFAPPVVPPSAGMLLVTPTHARAGVYVPPWSMGLYHPFMAYARTTCIQGMCWMGPHVPVASGPLCTHSPCSVGVH